MKSQNLLKARCFLSQFLLRALIAFILIFVLSWAMSQAHEQGKSATRLQHLGFYVGSGIASYREDLLVPLGFHGPALSLGALYSCQAENNLIDLRFRFGVGHMKNRYSHEAFVAMLEIRPSWIRKLYQHQRFGKFWAGICLPMNIDQLIDHSWDDSHLYWLTAYSLGVAMEWQKQISKKYNTEARIEAPFLSFVSRPPSYRYNKQDATDHFSFHFTEPNRSLHFETLDAYRGLFIQLLLRREMRCSLLSLGLEFQSNYCREPKPIWGLNTAILFSYQWRIES